MWRKSSRWEVWSYTKQDPVDKPPTSQEVLLLLKGVELNRNGGDFIERLPPDQVRQPGPDRQKGLLIFHCTVALPPSPDLGFPPCFIWHKTAGMAKEVAGRRIPHLWLRWGGNLFLVVHFDQLLRESKEIGGLQSSLDTLPPGPQFEPPDPRVRVPPPREQGPPRLLHPPPRCARPSQNPVKVNIFYTGSIAIRTRLRLNEINMVLNY